MSTPVSFSDPIFHYIQDELRRQQNYIELIASENIVSSAVLAAQGSILTNKYAEGYPGKRYYGGCEFVDKVELLAIERVKQLFGCQFANVQAHSGSQANQAVFMAILKPGDTILGMSLNAGGHLTHGAAPNLSGKWFNAQSYGVDPVSGLLDYEEIEQLAKLHQPKLIIAGGSAYVRQIDFARMKSIAEEVGAVLMADVAHYAGLIVGGVYPNPFPYADVVTSTTHKTLRGPRGGIILTNSEALAKKINAAIFPGLQGGPLMHVIAAKAVAFQEALLPAFKEYARDVLENARILGKVLEQRKIALVSGGTDCHMVLIDLASLGQGSVTGKDAEYWLEKAGLTTNKNSTPNDSRGPTLTSGIRLGTPAGTTRGFGKSEFTKIANYIADVLEALAGTEETVLERTIKQTREEVTALCHAFPIYSKLN